LKAIWAVSIIASILILGTSGIQDAFAPIQLEINPDSQVPGKKFRLSDPEGRFVDGTVAVFKLGVVEEAVVPLKIGAQGKKAIGVTPALPGGTYDIIARTPIVDFDFGGDTLDISDIFSDDLCEGDDTIFGTEDNDDIPGTPLDDVISGLGGNDEILAGAGDDIICGDDGDDTLTGGAGDDFLTGGEGNDTFVFGDGDDTLVGGPGDDTLEGGDGDDTLVGGDGIDFLIGGEGDDTCFADVDDSPPPDCETVIFL